MVSLPQGYFSMFSVYQESLMVKCNKSKNKSEDTRSREMDWNRSIQMGCHIPENRPDCINF